MESAKRKQSRNLGRNLSQFGPRTARQSVRISKTRGSGGLTFPLTKMEPSTEEGCMPMPEVCCSAKLCLFDSLPSKAALGSTVWMGRCNLGTDAFLQGTLPLCSKRKWPRVPLQGQDLGVLEDWTKASYPPTASISGEGKFIKTKNPRHSIGCGKIDVQTQF